MDERALGANIRQLREAAGLTVTALAKQSALTKSTLSKIETGQTSPPISTLMRIADALGTPLAQFFLEPQQQPACIHTPAGQGRVITRDGSRFGYSYEALALDMPRKRAEPFMLTIQPGDPVGCFRHGGQEFIYMLEGKLEFTVGSRKMTLTPGDSLYFDPQHEHTTRVVSRKPARFLCLFIQEPAPAGSAAPARPAARTRRRRPQP